MKKFMFEYDEVCRGVVIVYAENEDEALDKAHSGEGEVFINKSQEEVGALIEVSDVNE